MKGTASHPPPTPRSHCSGKRSAQWQRREGISDRRHRRLDAGVVSTTTAEGYLRTFVKATNSSSWVAINSADVLGQSGDDSWTWGDAQGAGIPRSVASFPSDLERIQKI